MNQQANKSQDGGSTRREFLKKSSLAVAAVAGTNLLKTPVYGQDQAPSANVAGANGRLQVGYIGVGGQGTAHMTIQKANAAANNIVQVAACDLSKTRRDAAQALLGPQCVVYKDFEKLLDNKDIDAVTIATVDHWHARTAIAALEAGKHVYCEKPMTRYLQEAFDLYDTVKKTGKKLQVGSQGCTAQAWHTAAGLINANKVGIPVWAQGYYCRNNPMGEWNYTILPWASDPQDLDWDKWQAPVKNKTPQNADAYFRWRKYYPYCAGPLGDLVPHRLLPLMLASGKPEFPVRVACVGTKNVHTDANYNKANTVQTPERDCPEWTEFLAEFPSGLTIQVVASTVTARSPGFTIYCNKASLEIGSVGERVQLIPEKPYAEDIDMQTFDGLTPTEDIGAHEKNWFDSIRNNTEPNANIELGVRAQTVISLAEMSNRLNIVCLFDEKTRRITNPEGKEIAAITYGTLERS